MRKKGFTLIELLAILVILAIMVLIALPSLTDTTRKTEEIKNQEVLNSIYMATENYIMANYDSTLDTIGGIVYVNVISDLMGQNYIDINTLNPNNNQIFSGTDVVKVTRNEDWTFNYELVTLPSLISILLNQYDENNTTGLVQDTTNSNIYYYTGTNGQVANNYLWYGGHQWRVIEFDLSSNTILLISQQPLTSIQPAAASWYDQDSYEKSYIARWLDQYFYSSLASSVQNNIINNTFNVGIYNNVDEITITQKVGLLDVGQYKRAGEASSYLNINENFWLGNRESSSSVVAVGTVGNGDWEGFVVTNSYGVRPVIKISDIIITEGDGTLKNSYKTSTKATSTNDVQVGEYINVPYNGTDGACGSDNLCTFRVVSKNSDSIKIILNGLLPVKSTYGSSSKINYGDAVLTSLVNFSNNIPVNYRHISSNNIFYIGIYTNGSSYTDVMSEGLYPVVGLPIIGEMFSGNDIDMSTSNTKTFVNVVTLENSKVATDYWTMNRYNSSYVNVINSGGGMSTMGPTNLSGVRPVILLKFDLVFDEGNGTAENPYKLK